MRIMTWNLWWRFGHYEQRLPAIAAVLEDVDADVVLLQEVWAQGSLNQAELLAGERSFEWAWSPSPDAEAFRRGTDEPEADIGIAVLSRWPITSTAETRLKAAPHGDNRGRTVLHALIATPAGTMPVFTTHLPSAPHLSGVRVQQVEELATFVAEHAAGHDLSAVVTGDFNAEPDSDEMRLLCGHKTAPVVPGQILVDVWRYAAQDDAGFSWDRRNPNVAASGSFSARIDYVLVGPRPGTRGRLERVGLAGDAPVAGIWPSDHFAVVVDLS